VSAAVVVVVVGVPAATTVHQLPDIGRRERRRVDESWFDPDVIVASVTVLPSAFTPYDFAGKTGVRSLRRLRVPESGVLVSE
jgi:hypothetical protein